ncbi:hypothetical protein Tco_1245877, partial [Tanacetum coccineum]
CMSTIHPDLLNINVYEMLSFLPCVPCGSRLVDMHKHVIQASQFMLQMLHTSLYLKESEQVDENVNKNFPDQNDVDFGEGGLAICIVIEVAKNETEKMLIEMVEVELEIKKIDGKYKKEFKGHPHFLSNGPK